MGTKQSGITISINLLTKVPRRSDSEIIMLRPHELMKSELLSFANHLESNTSGKHINVTGIRYNVPNVCFETIKTSEGIKLQVFVNTLTSTSEVTLPGHCREYAKGFRNLAHLLRKGNTEKAPERVMNEIKQLFCCE